MVGIGLERPALARPAADEAEGAVPHRRLAVGVLHHHLGSQMWLSPKALFFVTVFGIFLVGLYVHASTAGPERTSLYRNASNPLDSRQRCHRRRWNGVRQTRAEAAPDDVRKMRVRSRLMRRVAEDRDVASTRGRRGSRFRTWLLGGSGWAAAAILLVMVVTHHAVLEPLGSGWLVAAFLLAVALALGAYALRLRPRLEDGRRSSGRF
jgi:hypothetical protein